ncbi:MAG: hypothetical protein EBU83_05945 [bacterium]|nr:hypothetical protein [Candidatus Aquidulcis sp.]
MKKGDLVKLCCTAWRPTHDNVTVAWTDPDEELESDESPLETSFKVGTAAVFLGSRKYEWWEQKIVHIIIDGRRGWVFEDEIEPL